MLDLTQDQLEKMPAFDYYKYGLRRDYIYRPFCTVPPILLSSESNEFVQVPIDISTLTTPRHIGNIMRGEYGQLHEWAYYPAMFLASMVIDRAVLNYQDQTVGEVQDLLINDKGVITKNNCWHGRLV